MAGGADSKRGATQAGVDAGQALQGGVGVGQVGTSAQTLSQTQVSTGRARCAVGEVGAETGQTVIGAHLAVSVVDDHLPSRTVTHARRPPQVVRTDAGQTGRSCGLATGARRRAGQTGTDRGVVPYWASGVAGRTQEVSIGQASKAGLSASPTARAAWSGAGQTSITVLVVAQRTRRDAVEVEEQRQAGERVATGAIGGRSRTSTAGRGTTYAGGIYQKFGSVDAGQTR